MLSVKMHVVVVVVVVVLGRLVVMMVVVVVVLVEVGSMSSRNDVPQQSQCTPRARG